jgi:hypothetical protein
MEVGGRTPALDGLADLEKRDRVDYSRIMRVIRLVAGNHRVMNPKHVRADAKGRGVYEMRGKHARLFFFYASDTDEIVVCTNLYWKAKPSKKEQDAAFARCSEMRDLYEASRRRPATRRV